MLPQKKRMASGSVAPRALHSGWTTAIAVEQKEAGASPQSTLDLPRRSNASFLLAGVDSNAVHRKNSDRAVEHRRKLAHTKRARFLYNRSCTNEDPNGSFSRHRRVRDAHPERSRVFLICTICSLTVLFLSRVGVRTASRLTHSIHWRSVFFCPPVAWSSSCRLSWSGWFGTLFLGERHVLILHADIADPRILSWWTETDLRTDSLHQSDAPLGLTWCS